MPTRELRIQNSECIIKERGFTLIEGVRLPIKSEWRSSSDSVKPRGFTLIELMVVIAIIAILSVVGITIFSNAQKSARDAKRRADIDAIANAMEVNYSAITGTYAQLSDTMFASGKIPIDPLTGSDSRGPTSCAEHECFYCGNMNTTYAGCSGSDNRIPDVTILSNDFTKYEVCANLESGSIGYYCRSNQQ